VIVVDSSAAVEALRGDRVAREFLSSMRAFAPHLIDAEVAHAVRGMSLGGLVTHHDGQRMISAWPRLGVVRFAMHPLLARAWELRANLSAYDAIYVALAEELRCPLVTADARIRRASGVTCEVTVLAD